MSRGRETAQVALVFLTLSCHYSPLQAQQVSVDPRAIAANWVVSQHAHQGIGELGLRLVVDTAQGAQGVGLRPVPLSGSEVHERRGVAARLGARPSTLTTHLRCPTEPPDAKELAKGIRRGCRLDGDVEALIQVDIPRVVDGGFDVGVVLWVSWADPGRPFDNYGVDRYYRVLQLRQQPAGELAVAGVRLMAQSRW